MPTGGPRMPVHDNPAVWKANCDKEERILHQQAVQRSLLSKESRIDALAIFRAECEQRRSPGATAALGDSTAGSSSSATFLDTLGRGKVAPVQRGTLLQKKDEATFVSPSAVDSNKDPLQRSYLEARDTSNRAYGWQVTPKDAVPAVWHGRRKQTDIGNGGQRPQK